MEIIIIFTAILQSIAVSLGIGSSTLAITNFLVAISDGKIEDTERKMMSIVYIILRIAMVLILLTTAALTAIQYSIHGTAFLSTFVVSFWLVIAVLFVNAILMTMHIMPSKFGPALQASSWYTLGVLMALSSLNLTGFTMLHFALAFVVTFLIATVVINGIMTSFKKIRNE